MLSVLYINLDRHPERRAHIERALTQSGVRPLRIRALEPPLAPNGAHFEGKLSPGETACYASHIKAWDTLLESEEPHALVLEDDALVPPDLAACVARIVSLLPAGWDLVHLYGEEGRAVRPLAAIGAQHDLVRYSRVPAGAVAYLLSRAGACKLRSREPRRWPIDTDLRRPWHFGLDSFGVRPPLVGHSDRFVSALGGKRARGRRGIALSSPLHSLEGAAWNMRKLGFSWWLRGLAWNSCRRLLRTKRQWSEFGARLLPRKVLQN